MWTRLSSFTPSAMRVSSSEPRSIVVIEGYTRMNAAILANPTTGANHAVRPYLCSCTDVGVLANHRVRPDACALRDARERRDNGGWMNPGGNRCSIQKQSGSLSKSELGVGDPQHGLVRQSQALAGDHAKCSRSGGSFRMLRGINID